LIRSAKVKPAMWLPFRIFVGFTRPRQQILGIELSGQIESVGANVSRFKPGASIIGYTGRRFGAYAQYVCLLDGGRFMPTDSLIAPKPRNISDAEAATVPTRATLAMYFLKRANVKPGHNVLVYGAAGVIGTFAVQLAKNAGANVTAVCSVANFDLVKSLGAVNVIDYTEDRAQIGGPYDVFFDAVGGSKESAVKSRAKAALSTEGISVSVDSSVAKVPASYLNEVSALIEAGRLRPVLDRTYPLEDAAAAHRYVEAGHKHGGVALAVDAGGVGA